MTATDAERLESGFALAFKGSLKSYFINGVVDHEDDGTLIGVEILGLLSECGNLVEPDQTQIASADLVSIAIDYEADAIYLRFRAGRATHQVVRQTVVVVDDDLGLCRVHVGPAR
jgi:hypothetical protein